jgi:hypothetical protein
MHPASATGALRFSDALVADQKPFCRARRLSGYFLATKK